MHGDKTTHSPDNPREPLKSYRLLSLTWPIFFGKPVRHAPWGR